VQIRVPLPHKMFKEPKAEVSQADLMDFLSNPLWPKVLVILQRKAVHHLSKKVTDSDFTTEAAKAEGVNGALEEIEKLIRKYSKDFKDEEE
jgi:hypothetical protein